ncbi:MAG: hypothetical protein WA624_10685 [Methylocella sp.]
MISTANSALTATIPVGGFPIGVAVTPDGRKAYVTCENGGSNSVSVIAIGFITLAGAGAIMIFPDQFWIGGTMIAIAVIGLVWLVLHHFGIRQQIIIPAAVMMAAVAFVYADRRYSHEPHDECIQAYGFNPANGISFMTVDTKSLLQYSDSHKLAFIIRVPYTDRDRMTDTVIEKSGLYTITNGLVKLAHMPSNILRFQPEQDNWLEYTLILVPSKFTIENISCLADVEHMGGKILAASARRSAASIWGDRQSSPRIRGAMR